MVDRDREEAVSRLAYARWEAEGRPTGQDKRHWGEANAAIPEGAWYSRHKLEAQISDMEFRIATVEDDPLLVRHYLAIWQSYGTPPDDLRDDAEDSVRRFLEEGRRDRALASFIAFDGEIAVGSASCQLHLMPYAAVLKPERSLQGYIWSVYVDPRHRKRGISKTLTTMAVDHLRDEGCTTVVLHSSEAGMQVYQSLGFRTAHEMRLKL